MKTKEFAELENAYIRFSLALIQAGDKLKERSSTKAAEAMYRLSSRIDNEIGEVLREMRLLEAQGA